MPGDTLDLRRSIAQAASYLEAKIASGDYSLSCVASRTESPWPHDKGHLFAAFFASEALGHDLSERGRSILTDRIYAESRNGLWSYAPDAHPGAISSDDTAFVLRCAGNLGLEESPERILKFYVQSETGYNAFTTFLNLVPPDPRLAFQQSLDNHRQFHPEVNANVFLLLKDTTMSKHIDPEVVAQSQAPEGYWHSYCYPGLYYGTHMFLDFIRDDPRFEVQRERGLAFLLASQNDDGSWGTPGEPYETSLAVNSVAVCGRFSGALERGIDFLLGSREPDGSWASRKAIWAWLEDEGDYWEAFDSNRIVTTSLALLALKRLSVRMST